MVGVYKHNSIIYKTATLEAICAFAVAIIDSVFLVFSDFIET